MPASWPTPLLASDADLLNDGGAAVWIHDGRRIQIGMEALREIIVEFIVTARLVEHGGNVGRRIPGCRTRQ